MTRPKFRSLLTADWDSPAFKRLPPARPCARYLLRYLELGPHTNSVPGLFTAGEAQITEALGWPSDATRPLFETLEREGLVQLDRENRVMFLPHRFKHEPPANEKAVKGWLPIIRE